MCYHLYTYDTQLYLSFDSDTPSSGSEAIARLEACISDIHEWMLTNRFKLNNDKTEFLKFLPQSNTNSDTPDSLQIGSDHIALSSKGKNLWVLFDPSLTLTLHITTTCKFANYQLYCLGRIKHYLSSDALKAAVHELISSKLDYCNSLLVGLPKTELSKFQHIMNCAARIFLLACSKQYIRPTKVVPPTKVPAPIRA